MPLLNTTDFTSVTWFAGGIALGALLPDIDQQDSILGRFNPFAKMLKHRTITHTLWAALLITFLCLHFGQRQPLWWGVALGYWLHLIEDSLSSEGVTWLYPLTHRHGHHHGYMTGGWFEKSIVTLATFALFWEIMWYLLF